MRFHLLDGLISWLKNYSHTYNLLDSWREFLNPILYLKPHGHGFEAFLKLHNPMRSKPSRPWILFVAGFLQIYFEALLKLRSPTKSSTLFETSRRISVISEKSGLSVGFCCQHPSNKSAILGCAMFMCMLRYGRKTPNCIERRARRSTNTSYAHRSSVMATTRRGERRRAIMDSIAYHMSHIATPFPGIWFLGFGFFMIHTRCFDPLAGNWDLLPSAKQNTVCSLSILNKTR